MADELDPRRHPFRSDIAAASLKDRIRAETFVEPESFQVRAPVIDLYAQPHAQALASQLLYGEMFDVYEQTDGLAWGQNKADGYVGYVAAAALSNPIPTHHRITANFAHLYEQPTFKSKPLCALSLGSLVHVSETTSDFLKTPDGYLCQKHIGQTSPDFVSEAARYLGVPYLWGGRSYFGLDCSALVQLSLAATGLTCPRDSDMQQAEVGDEVEGPYLRGDLVFWKGHVAIVYDEHTFLHANVHHMAVAFEPIADAIARIAKTDGPVLAHKRL